MRDRKNTLKKVRLIKCAHSAGATQRYVWPSLDRLPDGGDTLDVATFNCRARLANGAWLHGAHSKHSYRVNGKLFQEPVVKAESNFDNDQGDDVPLKPVTGPRREQGGDRICCLTD